MKLPQIRNICNIDGVYGVTVGLPGCHAPNVERTITMPSANWSDRSAQGWKLSIDESTDWQSQKGVRRPLHCATTESDSLERSAPKGSPSSNLNVHDRQTTSIKSIREPDINHDLIRLYDVGQAQAERASATRRDPRIDLTGQPMHSKSGSNERANFHSLVKAGMHLMSWSIILLSATSESIPTGRGLR